MTLSNNQKGGRKESNRDDKKLKWQTQHDKEQLPRAGSKERKRTAQRYTESSGRAQLKMKTIKQKYN